MVLNLGNQGGLTVHGLVTETGMLPSFPAGEMNKLYLTNKDAPYVPYMREQLDYWKGVYRNFTEES